MDKNYSFTLLVFCKIFNLSYSIPKSRNISPNHILNLFSYSEEKATVDEMNPASFCNSIKGIGQLKNRMRFINLTTVAAVRLMDGLDISTLHYIYRYLTQNAVNDKIIEDILIDILQIAMNPNKEKHLESVNYPNEYIESFRNPNFRNNFYISDEAVLGISKYDNNHSSPLMSPIEYCKKYGIEGFLNSGLSPDYLIQNLQDKSEIYILATTGANIISVLSAEFISQALINGVSFTILIPNKNSEFCNDVAEIETPYDRTLSKQAFASQFENVIKNLKRELLKALHLSKNKHIGSISVCNTFSLLRQTIIMGINNNIAWGWESLTLPPSRTINKTPSFVFSGNINDDTIAKVAYNHIQSLIDEAKYKKAFFLITPETVPETFNFGLEHSSAKEYWNKLYESAQNNMLSCITNTDELIEVAAQHPLNNGKPASEFQARLDYAFNLYNKLKTNNKNIHIYIPGSVHLTAEVTPPHSLSHAGKQYLLELGIPEQDLFGDEYNEMYKKEKGVYNSADECFVASKIFLNGCYKHIHSICSPNQMLRKQLFYLSHGVIPLFYTVPQEILSHGLIYELFDAIPDVIYNDHNWQDENSPNAIRTRKERMPNFHL